MSPSADPADLPVAAAGPTVRARAANDDALFYCRAGSRNCIFQTVLLLFKFHFGMRTNLDDANATGKFCNSLL